MLICSDSNRIWQIYYYTNKFINIYVRYIYILYVCEYTNTHFRTHNNTLHILFFLSCKHTKVNTSVSLPWQGQEILEIRVEYLFFLRCCTNISASKMSLINTKVSKGSSLADKPGCWDIFQGSSRLSFRKSATCLSNLAPAKEFKITFSSR